MDVVNQDINIITIPADIAECITQFLTLDIFVKLMTTNKKIAVLFGRYIHKLPWSVTKIFKLPNKIIFEYITKRVNHITGVKKLEQLSIFPALTSFKTHKMFPTNRMTSKRNLRAGFITKNVKRIEIIAKFDHTIEADSLPYGLEELILPNNYNKILDPLIIGQLPKLKYLRIGTNFANGQKRNNADIIPIDPKAFPVSLEKLEIHTPHILANNLKDIFERLINLKILVLTSAFNQILLILPANLVELVMGDKYNHDIMPVIKNHSTLRSITVGNTYSHKFDLPNMPKNLRWLTVGLDYKHYIHPEILPTNLILKLDLNTYCQVIINHYFKQLEQKTVKILV